MQVKPVNSPSYYRYLEQDERVLARMAKAKGAREAHLRIAESYRQLAEAAEKDGRT